MDKKANDTFAFDLENRLDDFFSDALPAHEEANVENPGDSKTDLPLKELKSTILAIDWEITDEALQTFIGQVDALMEQFADDKVNHTLLKILRSLGKYLRSHKSKAHPDTIKRLMSVYSALEKSVTTDELSPDDKEAMLRDQIKAFQQLKAQIVRPKPVVKAEGSQQPAAAGLDGSAADSLLQAVNEMKAAMMAELKAIRQELRDLRKS